MHVRHLEPTAGFFRESLSAYKLPFWNPYCYLGMPQLPDCFPGNFYPLNLFFLIPNYGTACVAFLLAHQVIGILGVYVASLKFGAKTVISRVVPGLLYAALSICLCGDENLALTAVLAWLPFCVFGMMRCVGLGSAEGDAKPHPGGLIVVNAIFLSLMMVAGATLVVGAAISMFILLLLIRLIQFKTKEGIQSHSPALALYLVSILVAACLASPVLLPLFEWASGPTTSSSVAPPAQIFENLARTCPNCSSFIGLIRGPETVSRESRDELAKKSDEMMRSIKSVAAHQGRYLIMFPKEEIPQGKDSNVVRSVLPNNNVKWQVSSSLGFLGHPSNLYKDIASAAIQSDPRLGFGYVPTDFESAYRLLCFCRLTSTGVIASYEWPDEGHTHVGFTDWRTFSEPLKKEPETWHLFQQTVTTPIAYSCDAWHWLKGGQELVDRAYSVKDAFDPRYLALIEKPERFEIDEEKLDKIPLTEGKPPTGPPMTDSPKVELPQNVTHIKAVEVLTYEPEHISLSVRVKAPSFIINNDTYAPGWKVYVDSVPAPCYRANGFARAVFVQAGSHAVTFDYRPDSLRIGGALAVGTFVLLILLTFYWLWKLLGKTVRLMSYGKFE